MYHLPSLKVPQVIFLQRPLSATSLYFKSNLPRRQLLTSSGWEIDAPAADLPFILPAKSYKFAESYECNPSTYSPFNNRWQKS